MKNIPFDDATLKAVFVTSLAALLTISEDNNELGQEQIFSIVKGLKEEHPTLGTEDIVHEIIRYTVHVILKQVVRDDINISYADQVIELLGQHQLKYMAKIRSAFFKKLATL